MKKQSFLFSILMLLMLINAKSQNEWAPVGTKWTYTQTFFFSAKIDTLIIRSTGDTVIQSHQCRILKKSMINCDFRPLKEYMYSENGKVFFYDNSRNKFQMLYNFNAAAGESITVYPAEFPQNDSIVFVVDSVSTITINSVNLKKIFVHHLFSANAWPVASDGVIIENIGDIYNMFPWVYGACDGSWSGPLRCFENPVIGFHDFETSPGCDYTTTGIDEIGNAPGISISPNPANDIFQVSGFTISPGKKSSLLISTIVGSKMTEIVLHKGQQSVEVNCSSWSPGMYIVQLMQNGCSVTKGKIVRR
jgi:hypothetical protein